MGVAESIVGVTSVSRNGLVMARRGRGSSAGGLDAAFNKGDLLSAVSDRPVATRLANNFNLLEERALVPVKSDLEDFAGVVEGHKVRLQGGAVSMYSDWAQTN